MAISVTSIDDRNAGLAGLLVDCANRDPLALRRLYERTAPILFATLLRILKSEELAEDALQETFVSVWRKAGEYRADKGQPLTWLTSIARYRALDILRRRRREVSLDALGIHAEPEAPAGEGPAHTASLASSVARLQECLDELEQTQRRSVELAFLDGYTHADLSRILEKPLGTVKSWVRRGLQALHGCMEP